MKTKEKQEQNSIQNKSNADLNQEGTSSMEPPQLFSGSSVKQNEEDSSNESAVLAMASSSSADPTSILNKYLQANFGALSILLGPFAPKVIDYIILTSRIARRIIEQFYLSNFNGTIDHTNDAVLHYYLGRGTSVTIGPKTRAEMKNSADQQYYLNRISQGLTSSPSDGSYGINMEDESYRSYHMGNTPIKYETTCNASTCTTVFTSKGDGFWDIFWGGDKHGSGGELGGYPYAYRSFTWTEKFANPGYPFDGKGKPSKIPSKVTPGTPPDHYYDSSSY